MPKIASVKRSATVAWASSSEHSSLLAAGTVAGAISESFDASASCTVSTAQAAFAIEGSGLSRITTLRGVTVGPRASPVTTDDAVMLRGVTAGPRECPVNTNAVLVARIESMALISRLTQPLISLGCPSLGRRELLEHFGSEPAMRPCRASYKQQPIVQDQNKTGGLLSVKEG